MAPDAGGSDDAPDTAYETRAAAEAAAEEFAAAHDEGDGEQDAEAYLEARLAEVAGAPDPAGEWCVYWATVGDRCHVVDRYATEAAARAACDLADQALARHYPGGSLLCGHQVRRLFGDQWQQPEQ